VNAEHLTGDEPRVGLRRPRRVRFPGFIKDEDIGLGEVVKRATWMAGIRPCRSCAERARRLDNWVVFSKKRS